MNRVSIGVQALNDADLKFLGRKHSAKDALQAIELAREHFERFSFDLIYARPEQTLESWQEELARAAALSGGHLSLYQLTVERNTPFHYDRAQGLFSIPNEDVAADFYTVTQEVLETAGLPAYEVSNHAAAGHESRHNLRYWHYGDYIGIGPGAHGRLTLENAHGRLSSGGQKHATREHQAPQIWLEMVEATGCGAHPFNALPDDECFLEALMMGLRLREGVELAHLSEQGGQDWEAYIDTAKFKITKNEGWLACDDQRMVLSREGMLRLNALVPYILKAQAPAVREG